MQNSPRIAFNMASTSQVICGPFFKFGAIVIVEIFGACIGLIPTNRRFSCVESLQRHRYDPRNQDTFPR